MSLSDLCFYPVLYIKMRMVFVRKPASPLWPTLSKDAAECKYQIPNASQEGHHSSYRFLRTTSAQRYNSCKVVGINKLSWRIAVVV